MASVQLLIRAPGLVQETEEGAHEGVIMRLCELPRLAWWHSSEVVVSSGGCTHAQQEPGGLKLRELLESCQKRLMLLPYGLQLTGHVLRRP